MCAASLADDSFQLYIYIFYIPRKHCIQILNREYISVKDHHDDRQSTYTHTKVYIKQMIVFLMKKNILTVN